MGHAKNILKCFVYYVGWVFKLKPIFVTTAANPKNVAYSKPKVLKNDQKITISILLPKFYYWSRCIL